MDNTLEILEEASLRPPHPLQIKIRYINDNPFKLEINSKGGCIDLYNRNNIKLKKGEYTFIHFGVAMELPRGYDAIILPRSSTFKRYGLLLSNSVGYIDNSYCGDNDEWLGCVYATKDIDIPAGTRCFQFRLIKQQPLIEFKEVENLNNQDRSGFGSTGV